MTSSAVIFSFRRLDSYVNAYMGVSYEIGGSLINIFVCRFSCRFQHVCRVCYGSSFSETSLCHGYFRAKVSLCLACLLGVAKARFSLAFLLRRTLGSLPCLPLRGKGHVRGGRGGIIPHE